MFTQTFNCYIGEEIDRSKFCCFQRSFEDFSKFDSKEFHSGGWSDGPGMDNNNVNNNINHATLSQVLPDDMISIRRSLHNMESHTIGCGPAGAAQPDEVVRISWVDEDKAVNIG